MPDGKVHGNEKQFVVRLTGLQPGASGDVLASALRRLFPKKTSEEIQRAMARLPLVLLRAASEEQARKVKDFLEAKGGLISTGTADPPTQTWPREERRREMQFPAPTPPPLSPDAASESQAPPGGIERRTKTRLHKGIQLHPMGIGEIMDRSFRLLRQNFWLLFFILFIPQAVFFVVSTALRLTMTGGTVQGAPTPAMGAGFAVSTFISLLIFLVFQFWSQGALIHAVSENYLGHSTSVKEAYGAVRRRLWRLIGTLILVGILVGLVPGLTGIAAAIIIPLFAKADVSKVIIGFLGFFAVVFCVWAMFYFFLNYLLVDKVVVIEDIGGLEALRRSKTLMRTRTESGFWKGPKMKISLILLLGSLVAIGIHLVIQIPGAVLGIFMKGNFMALTIHGILQMVANSLATVFTATAVILYYYDIRVRKEGFDLKMMAENL